MTDIVERIDRRKASSPLISAEQTAAFRGYESCVLVGCIIKSY